MPSASSSIFGPSTLLTNGRRKKSGQRQYAAAKVSRLTGEWMPVGQSVNDILRTSSTTVRNRVRQLVRDFPYFNRAANLMVDLTVGTGMTFQSRVLNPDWQPGAKGVPKFDRATSQRIEDAVLWGMEEIDASGRQHFADLERLAKREDVEAGEFLFVKTYLKDPQRYIPFALQAYEAEWLTDNGATPQGKNKIEQGVEYDPATGRTVAVHIADPDNYKMAKRIPAEYILHGFETRRSGQLRGISPFVTAVLIAHDLGDYLDATIDTAKLAAKYLALVETPDPAGFQKLRTTPGTGEDVDKKIETLENAIIEYLRPGEQIKFAKNDNPGETFDPFTRFVLKTVSIATGVPYSALSGNHGDYNYTSLRGERQDVLKTIAPQQNRHVRQFSDPVSRDIITSAVMSGRLDLPGYFKNPRRYWRGLWIPPGMEPIDPLRESKANRDDVEACLRSPQEIAARRGRSIEDIVDEVAEFYQMLDERDIPYASTDTALASNPAAIGADEGSKNLRALLSRVIEDVLDGREMLLEE